MLFDQAIFSSARTATCSGYHLVAASEGISFDEARELTQWCPAHDSLIGVPAAAGEQCANHEDARGPDGTHDRLSEQKMALQSLNFHPVGERFCLSRTTAEGEEYSRRGGPLVTTRCVVMGRASLLRFGNNPFAIDRALHAIGFWETPETRGEPLRQFSLAGRAGWCDATMVHRAIAKWGTGALIATLDAALGDRRLLIRNRDPALLFAALHSSLPVRARTNGSFTTGLRFSRGRPFRWQVANGDEDELRRIHRSREFEFVDVDACERVEPLRHAWTKLAAASISERRLAELSRLQQQGFASNEAL